MNLEFELKAILPNQEIGMAHTAYLFNPENKILLPIVTNQWACESLVLASSHQKQARPHIHDTFKRMMMFLGGDLENVFVYKYLSEIFYAYLRVRKGEIVFEIDVKLTDALCLALQFNKPILVSDEVYDVAGIVVTKELLQRSIGSQNISGM